jgi:putative membrane protein
MLDAQEVNGRASPRIARLLRLPVSGPKSRALLDRLSEPLGRYGGLALILSGLALIVAATTRFVRTGRLLNDPETHSASSVRAEMILSVMLVLLVAGLSTFLVLG